MLRTIEHPHLTTSFYPTQRVFTAACWAFRQNRGIWIKNIWSESRGTPNIILIKKVLAENERVGETVNKCSKIMFNFFRRGFWSILSGDMSDPCLRKAVSICYKDEISIDNLDFLSRMPYQYFIYDKSKKSQKILDRLLWAD